MLSFQREKSDFCIQVYKTALFTKLKRHSHHCSICSDSEPETSYQSLPEGKSWLLSRNHRIQLAQVPLLSHDHLPVVDVGKQCWMQGRQDQLLRTWHLNHVLFPGLRHHHLLITPARNLGQSLNPTFPTRLISTSLPYQTLHILLLPLRFHLAT